MALIVAVGLGATVAADDRPQVLDMKIAERGGALHITTAVTSVFDVAAYDRLEDGLLATVVIRMWVFPKGSKRPLAFQLLHRELVYDLWGEAYEVALTGPDGRRVYRVKYRAEALKLVTEFYQFPIADLSVIPFDEPVEVAVVAELNPVSAETMAEVRRWLSDGSGGGLDRGGSFFGSFVSVFVNLKVPDADRVLRTRSKAYTRRRPAP